MSPPDLIWLLVVGFLGGCALTAVFRRYALKAQLLDHPNARSSHAVPTPRGGGVAFVLAFLPLLGLVGWWDATLRQFALALLGGGVLVAAIGFADDRRHVSTRTRLLSHLAAGVWVVAWVDPWPAIPMLGVMVDFGPFASLLALLFLVWMVNLFNFMDGIDAIASVEAITVALGGALLWWLTGTGTGWMMAGLFAACVAGFLVWNWPPARIFMGDAGSGFLGFTIAAMALWCGQGTAHLFWGWLILVGCFMVDTTTTLVRRVLRGSRFDLPHRTHAYQYAARSVGRHLPVTLAVAAINLLWLLPVATLVALGYVDGVVGVTIAYIPLVWLSRRFNAGLPEAGTDAHPRPT